MEKLNMVALILFIVGITFVITALKYMRQRKRLRTHGIVTRATVTSVQETIRQTTSGGVGHNRTEKDYIHHLTFLANGQAYTGTLREYSSRAVGDGVDIVYNPSNPSDMLRADNVDGGTKNTMLISLFIIVGLGLVVAAIIIHF